MSPPRVRWWERPESPTAFISHASADATQAAEIVRVLEAARLRCWLAPRDIPVGSEWATAIVDGIRRSRLLVVVFSVRSCASPEVYREVELASRERKPMLTVRIDRTAELTGPLAFFLSSIQWFEATARPLRPQLGRLPSTVAGLLDVPVTPPPPPTAAPVSGAQPEESIRSVSLDDLTRSGPIFRPWAH
ncbi:TIR domain-containing protein [Geodermatophilus africanus]|uniref:TIR domain-containing protein n=1 Tax=Geodermatophilus africanus TaxID=1137993 RepID=A0A1H3HGF4_9ACTN|nr:toll/interleukin-1 receptor domain-containing protein [Geodermatophilus africanus]SDY14542.1 TIR domain-containing protein [Geodermatophilus africanus]